MNHLHLVGTISNIDKEVYSHKTSKLLPFSVSVLSNFKDANGKYLVENFDVYFWKGASKSIQNAINIGHLVTLRGRLEKLDEQIIIVAEHLEILDHSLLLNELDKNGEM